MRGGPPELAGVKRLVGQRDLASLECAWQRFGRFGLAFAGVEPGQDRQWALGGEQRVRQRRRFRADLAGVVAEEFAQPVAQGAAGAQPAAVQLAFLRAAAAPKRRGESRAVRADRGLVMGAQAGKHAVLTATRATTPDAQRPVMAGATDLAIGPAASLEPASPTAAASVMYQRSYCSSLA
jgi:hypothetical protein